MADGASAVEEERSDDGGLLTDDEFGSLISFANLENVVKHIIRKFKNLESQNESTDAQLAGVKRELEARATNRAVEEVVSDIGARFEGMNKMLQGQKESLSALETMLERNRVTCSNLENKLEATVKEKAVQDRLIREIQDALQDKVAVTELNMFEAKFGGYTTKLEHQEVINSLSHYARVDVAERIAESVKVIGTQFDDYMRTAKIEQQLQELRDWVCGELQHYARAKQTAEKWEELHSLIRDQFIGFERTFASLDDKTRGLSDRVTSIYQELNNDINQRALADDLREVQTSLRKYALRADTEAFQHECVPKLKFCVDSIKAFDDRLRAQDDSIHRVDEVLLDKAGKYDIVVINSRLDQCLQKEIGLKEFGKMHERLEWMNRKLEQYIDGEADRLEALRPPDYQPLFEDMSTRILLKADKADMVEMYQLKANRLDADELAKLQETIHRQLEYLSVTNFGLAKLVLTDCKPNESKAIRTQQKAQVLMQSEALWNWILHNEPPPNLGTLRPPPGKSQGNDGGDQQKRLVDDQKRLQLERKLGIQGT